MELSIVMPCLDEENTVGICVETAWKFIREHQIDGEVLVVDNASVDGSGDVARMHGAKVLCEPKRGYGNALRAGFLKAEGDIIIMGDCDTTYDFGQLEQMYTALAENRYDMVIGNRYAGGIERGAMPFSHRWGVRALSYMGRRCFSVDVYDFHCGLRGMTRQAYQRLELETEGMEFATEMIAEAAKKKLRVGEVPVSLKRCTAQRKSKLNTIRDGLRHFRYLLWNWRDYK